MLAFGKWMVSSLPRFIVGAGALIAAPMAILLLCLSQSNGDLSVRYAMILLALSAAGGVVWSLAMWFTFVSPLKRRLQRQRPDKPST